MTMAIVASSNVAGNTRSRSLSTGCEVSTDIPKSPRHEALEVDEILDDERLIEAELAIDVVVGRLARPIADDGNHRVDVGQPADEEGDGRQANERHHQREEERCAAAEDGDTPSPEVTARHRVHAQDGVSVSAATNLVTNEITAAAPGLGRSATVTHFQPQAKPGQAPG